MLNRNFGNYYRVHDHQQKLISYKNVVKKNDIINLPRSQDPLMCSKSTWICLVHFLYTFSKHNSKTHASSLLVCCVVHVQFLDALHTFSIGQIWLCHGCLGLFQASAAQHLLFQTMRIVCFLWVKGLDQSCAGIWLC
jgi:hypothetical protein